MIGLVEALLLFLLLSVYWLGMAALVSLRKKFKKTNIFLIFRRVEKTLSSRILATKY
jgi:hypothetical protein